ncbi:hypothetical protein MASR1M32_41570 [Rhodobacter sp.]
MKRAPGWDAIEVNRIAKERFGSLAAMFEHFGWPERGAQMMTSVGGHICRTFGNVENFVREYAQNDASD